MTDVFKEYESFFYRNEPLYKRLNEEVDFILKRAVADAGIKVHSQGGRVKNLEHALEKIQRKAYTDPKNQMEDVVGYRVVCLFATDLPKLTDIISQKFSLLRSESNIEGDNDPATFGYMSEHHICQLNPSDSGARYEDIQGITFEIQCRTILMDAWANVSHHLAYKGNASIPEHLRRDFYALSGLFYVADKHFEMFYGDATSSAQEVFSRAVSGSIDEDEVNLETVQALFQQLYPDRRRAAAAMVSEFVEEIVPLGYTSIRELRRTLENVDEEVRSDDARRNVNHKYIDVGMARVGLTKADAGYASMMNKKTRARSLPKHPHS